MHITFRTVPASPGATILVEAVIDGSVVAWETLCANTKNVLSVKLSPNANADQQEVVLRGVFNNARNARGGSLPSVTKTLRSVWKQRHGDLRVSALMATLKEYGIPVATA